MPTRRLLVSLLALCAAAAVAAATTLSASPASIDRMAAWLPAMGASEVHRTSLDDFRVESLLGGDHVADVNEARLERDAERAVRSLAAGRPGAVPASMAFARNGHQARVLRTALDGIPAAELTLTTRAYRPQRVLDPWRVEIVLDVRDIGSSEANFSTPRTSVELELRPWGDPRSQVVRRWQVRRMELDRGGLLLLDRDVAYVRTKRAGVLAPESARATAKRIAELADEMLPMLERRYPKMRRSSAGVFVVLAPSGRRASRVMSQLNAGTLEHADGVATSDANITLDLRTWGKMRDFERRSLLRHELAHLAAHDLSDSRLDLYVEGLATWEGDHEVVATGTWYMLNDVAIKGVRSGRFDLDEMLFEPDTFVGLGSSRWDAYRLGAQVADYLDSTYGHDRAVRFYRAIGRDGDVRKAVRRVLRTSPQAYRAAVERWVYAHPTWQG